MKMESKTIIIDSNAAIYTIKFRIDILGQLTSLGFRKVVVPDCVIRELEGLTGDIAEAKAALSIISDLERIPSTDPCDFSIIRAAKENKFSILTNDREVITEAKKNNVKAFTIKRKRIIGSV